MLDDEKLTESLSTRVTPRQKAKVDELGVNLREIVDYYITHKTNPTLELKNRQRELLKKIEEAKNNLKDWEEELKEVNIKLGVAIDENIATIDVITISERIKDNCKIKHKEKCDKTTIADFIIAGDGKQILKHGMAEFGIKHEDKKRIFLNNVFKYMGILNEIRESDFENLLIQL